MENKNKKEHNINYNEYQTIFDSHFWECFFKYIKCLICFMAIIFAIATVLLFLCLLFNIN